MTASGITAGATIAMSGVAQAARSTTEGAANTRTSADELSKMALDLQTLVSQFRY